MKTNDSQGRRDSLFSNVLKLLALYKMPMIPLKGKKPQVRSWQKYCKKPQTESELLILFNRTGISGIGIILCNSLRALDLDGVNSMELLYEMLNILGLPYGYKHIVKTGNGFHIYFYCNDDSLIQKYFGRKNTVYPCGFLNPRDGKQVELRWEKCYVVSAYSKHVNGNTYQFINGEPTSRPAKISGAKVIKVFESYTFSKSHQIKNNENVSQSDAKHGLVIKSLQNSKLNYLEWSACCFALCSLGETGRKYFVQLSTNKFYDDSPEKLNEVYDQHLEKYDSHRSTIGLLYHIAKQKGFQSETKKLKLDKEFLEFELCALSYPSISNDERIFFIISYSLVQKYKGVLSDSENQEDMIADSFERIGIPYNADEVIEYHQKMKKYIEGCKAIYGEEPFCRIAENFFLDVLKERFDYLTFCILSAIIAIQGKKDTYKKINYDRLKAAILGYKSNKILKAVNDSRELSSEYRISKRVNILCQKKIIAKSNTRREQYFSTRLSQKQLDDKVRNIVDNRAVKKAQRELQDRIFQNHLKQVNAIAYERERERLLNQMYNKN